jgi:hypothetical protein
MNPYVLAYLQYLQLFRPRFGLGLESRVPYVGVNVFGRRFPAWQMTNLYARSLSNIATPPRLTGYGPFA